MANQIDAIKAIDKELEKLISRLKEVNIEIVNTSKNAREITTSFSSVKTPKGLSDELKKTASNTEQVNALIKEREATERKLISTIAKKVLVQDKATKALSKENEELKILRREQRNQVKAVSNLAGSYTKLSSQTNILIKRYQDLAVRQAKGEQLTAKETRRLERLGQVIEKNQTILKKTDAEVGRFQRNVGNYASGFDGLGMSIAQLTREAPAFAVSMQTGFLALSNNLPILADEIGRLNQRNKELAANGEPTKNVFKSLGAAIFSFQTLLSAGVLILTLYGDKIIEFIQKASSGGDKVRDLAKQQQILNETYKEAAKTASGEIAQLQLLIAFAGDKTKSDESRKKAVDKLIKSSGGLIKEQDRLNILNGEALDIEKKLVKAILNKAIVQQLQTKIAEDINKLLDTQISLAKSTEERTRTLTIEELKNAKAKGELNDIEDKITINRRKAGQLDERIIDLNKQKNIQQENVNNLIKSAIKLTDDYTLSLDDNNGKIEKRNKAVSLAIELEKERETNLKVAEETIKRLLDLYKDDASFELPEIDQQSLDKFSEQISKAIFADKTKEDAAKRLRDGVSDLFGTMQDVLGVNASVFDTFFDRITEKGEKSFDQIADIAASSFDVIGELGNALFDGRIQKYEEDIEANNEYYANLLENENLTEEERKRLELDRKNEEKRIKKEKEKEEKKAFLFNQALAIADIGINLAKTISAINLAAAAQDAITPFAFGATGAAFRAVNLPLAIASAAVQTGVVLAKTLPAFAEGGKMDHDGLMMINDHKSGRLEVVERNGKLLMTDKRNAIVEGKRGDIIHKDAKEYFNNLSDKQILEDVNNHAIMATLQQQNYLLNKFDNKKVIDNERMHTEMIVKAIKSKKSRFVLNQNISLAEDLKYLSRLNNTL